MMKKSIAAVAALVGLSFVGSSAAFAADHTYVVGSGPAAIDARDAKVNSTNKWDRPKVLIEESLKLKGVLEGYEAALNADIADLEKAVAVAEESIKNSAADVEAKIAENNKKIAEIQQSYEIYKEAHGEDMAKYFLKAKLEEKANLEKANADLQSSDPALEVTKQGLKDNKDKLKKLTEDRRLIHNQLYKMSINQCTYYGNCNVAEIPSETKPDDETKPADQTKPADETKPSGKSVEKTSVKSADKPEVKGLSNTGTDSAPIAGFSVLSVLAGAVAIAARRRFVA